MNVLGAEVGYRSGSRRRVSKYLVDVIVSGGSTFVRALDLSWHSHLLQSNDTCWRGHLAKQRILEARPNVMTYSDSGLHNVAFASLLHEYDLTLEEYCSTAHPQRSISTRQIGRRLMRCLLNITASSSQSPD